MKSTTAFAALLADRPRVWAGLALLMTLVTAPFLPSLRVDNALEVWLDQDSMAFAEYQGFLETFGSEEFILLIYDLPQPIPQPLLEQLTDLRYDLEEVEGVREVHCLSSLFARFFSLRGLEAFDDDLRQSPFYRRFLISEDGERAAQWIWLDFENPGDRAQIVAKVERLGRASPLTGVHFAGSPVLNVALDRASQDSARRLFPAVFGWSALLLWLLFRRFYGVLIPFLSVGLGILWTLAILAATGHTLNMVTVALPPLVWVLGLSTSIHLMSRCEQIRREKGRQGDAARETLRELLRPCAYSAITTALGFASLLASGMEPIREMGFFASVGVLACFASNVLLFPWLSAWIRPRHRAAGQRFTMALEATLNLLANWTRLHPRRILAGFFILTLGLGWGISRLQAEASVIEFFKPEAEISRVYHGVLPGFTGAYSLEIVFEPPERHLETFRQLDRLEREIETLDGAMRVLSAADLLAKAHQVAEALPSQSDVLPQDEVVFQRVREAMEARMGRELASFEADGTLRASVLTAAMGSDEHRQLVESLEAFLDEAVDPLWKPRLTGIVRLLVDLQRQLLDSQIRSFTLAFGIIGLVMWFLMRSRKDVWMSLLPNLFPILSVLGVMGWMGIPLDPATVMIAGIALGIAVDDTIHFLVHFREARHAGESVTEALHASYHTAGRAIVLTTIVAALGFFVLSQAAFVPLIYFGVLTGLTAIAALVGDLLLLPALIGLVESDTPP